MSQLVFRTAFAVTDQYGASLEEEDFRTNEENKIRQLLNASADFTRREADDALVELGAAGNVAGLKIGIGDTVLGAESRNRTASIPELVSVVREVRQQIQGITGFRVPGGYRGFGEMTNTPLWVVELDDR